MSRTWRFLTGTVLVVGLLLPAGAFAQGETTATKKKLEQSNTAVDRMIASQSELDAFERTLEANQERPENLRETGLIIGAGGAALGELSRRRANRAATRGPLPGEMLHTHQARILRARRMRNFGYGTSAFGGLLFLGGLADGYYQESQQEELARENEVLFDNMNAERALQFQILNAQIRAEAEAEAAKRAAATSEGTGDNTPRQAPFGGLMGAPGTVQATAGTTENPATKTAETQTAPQRGEKK